MSRAHPYTQPWKPSVKMLGVATMEWKAKTDTFPVIDKVCNEGVGVRKVLEPRMKQSVKSLKRLHALPDRKRIEQSRPADKIFSDTPIV